MILPHAVCNITTWYRNCTGVVCTNGQKISCSWVPPTVTSNLDYYPTLGRSLVLLQDWESLFIWKIISSNIEHLFQTGMHYNFYPFTQRSQVFSCHFHHRRAYQWNWIRGTCTTSCLIISFNDIIIQVTLLTFPPCSVSPQQTNTVMVLQMEYSSFNTPEGACMYTHQPQGYDGDTYCVFYHTPVFSLVMVHLTTHFPSLLSQPSTN